MADMAEPCDDGEWIASLSETEECESPEDMPDIPESEHAIQTEECKTQVPEPPQDAVETPQVACTLVETTPQFEEKKDVVPITLGPDAFVEEAHPRAGLMETPKKKRAGGTLLDFFRCSRRIKSC